MMNKELYDYFVNKELKREDDLQNAIREALARKQTEDDQRPFLDLDDLCN